MSDLGLALMYGACYATGKTIGETIWPHEPLLFPRTNWEKLRQFIATTIEFTLWIFFFYVLIIFVVVFTYQYYFVWENQDYVGKNNNKIQLNPVFDARRIDNWTREYLPPELCDIIYGYILPIMGSRCRIIQSPEHLISNQNIEGSIEIHNYDNKHTFSIGGSSSSSSLLKREHPFSKYPAFVSVQSPLLNWGIITKAFLNCHSYCYENTYFLELAFEGFRLDPDQRFSVKVTLHLPSDHPLTSDSSGSVNCMQMSPGLFLFELGGIPRQYYWKIPSDFSLRLLQDFHPNIRIFEYQDQVTGVVESDQYLLGQPSLSDWGRWFACDLLLPKYKVVAANNILVRWDIHKQRLTALSFYVDYNGKMQYEIEHQKIKSPFETGDLRLLCSQQPGMKNSQCAIFIFSHETRDIIILD